MTPSCSTMCRTTAWVLAGSPPSSAKTRRTGWPFSPPRLFSEAAQARTPAAADRVTAPRIPVWASNDPKTISEPRPGAAPGPAGGDGIDCPAVEPGAGPASGRSTERVGAPVVDGGPALPVDAGGVADPSATAPAAGGAPADIARRTSNGRAARPGAAWAAPPGGPAAAGGLPRPAGPGGG